MASHAATHDHAHEHSHGGPRTYILVLAALLALTFLTVFVARHPFDNNLINILVALFIATCKATLVGLFFMHLKDDNPVNGFILLISVLFVCLLILFSLMDLSNRDNVVPGSYKDGVNEVYKAPAGIAPGDFSKPRQGSAEGEKKEH